MVHIYASPAGAAFLPFSTGLSTIESSKKMPPEGGNLDGACVGTSDFQGIWQVSPSVKNRAQSLRVESRLHFVSGQQPFQLRLLAFRLDQKAFEGHISAAEARYCGGRNPSVAFARNADSLQHHPAELA